MSGGFHVHGPHDHAIEHAAQGGHGAHAADDDNFSGRIAMITAILATVGALFAYQGGATQANAMLFKNNAAIKKTEASNQWNYYQAKSGKQNLAELSVEIAPAKKAFYEDEIKRYKSEKKEIQIKAESLEKESKDWDVKSDDELHNHHRWAQATTVLQIAIALSAIALITRRRWLAVGVYGVSIVGLIVGALAFLHI
jgi:Domain of unknown function (DUF4337)